MKLSSDNSRYHKPGNSWVLRYNYTPSNSRVWTNEAVQKSGVAMAPTIIYDSTIFYISYDEPHEHEFSYKYEWIDKEYHYSYCECGFKTKVGHVVTGSPNARGEYNCLLCGRIAEIGFSIIGNYSKSNITDNTFFMKMEYCIYLHPII